MALEDASFDLTDRQEIFRALKTLQISKSLVNIRIKGQEKTYSSMVVGIDSKKKLFLIDELQPNDGNRLIRSGTPFSIHGNYEGVKISAKNLSAKADLQKVEVNGELTRLPCFKVSIPSSLLYRQRRDAFRVSVSKSSWVSLSNTQHSFIRGEILDISTNGLGCRLEGHIQPELEYGELFPRSELSIDNNFNLNCELKMRHPRYHRLEDATYCGLSFEVLDNYHQRRLDRFILDTQRRQRKELQNAANY